MDNVILSKTLSAVWRLLVLYALYILLRGHNEPGGGFIGGLLLALGLIIRSHISRSDRLPNHVDQHFLTYLGTLLLCLIGIISLPILLGLPVFSGLWTGLWVPIAGKFSSVLLFDLVVFCVVSLSAVHAYWSLRSDQTTGVRGN